MVDHTGWQVEHVALFEDVLLNRLEVAQDTQWQPGNEVLRAAILVAELPATAPRPLDEEHIVIIRMGTDGTLIRSIADHHIIQPPVGQEAKTFLQQGKLRYMFVDLLHQHGPMRIRQGKEIRFRERPVFDLPGRFAMFLDQA